MDIKERIRSLFPREEEVPRDVLPGAPIHQDVYLVDGELARWQGETRDALSPVCLETPGGPRRKVLGSYPLLTAREALSAVDAARSAYDYGSGDWPTMPVSRRIEHVEEFARRMKDVEEEVVKLIMWEIGKSLEDSQREFTRTIRYINDTVDALKDLDRVCSRFVIQEGIIAQIRRAPLGVVLCMGPFNYPLNETFATLIPALVMGNAVVLKPPKQGVLLYGPLLKAFRDCFPRGVVNTVYGEGREMVPPIMSSGRVDVLAFIGTSIAADHLKKAHPKPHRLRCVLGLEAKNPAIVLKDADLDLAVSECLRGGLSFNGQRCTALKIFFVHERVQDEFLERLSEALASVHFGMPWEKGVVITPLAEPTKPEYLSALVDDAVNLGAKIVNPGGARVNESFFYPAALFPVSEKMRVYHEEQFGPVMPVVPFSEIETPVRYMIESNYGQQVSVFGRDPVEIAGLIDPLVNQVCRVNLNCQCQRSPDSFPFTGRKDSAEGTLSVSDALRVFSIRTLVAAKEMEINKSIISEIVKDRRSNFLSTDFIL